MNWSIQLAWLGCDADGQGSISISSLIEALEYAEAHDISITNNSYGGCSYSHIFEQAIENYDGLFVVSAGNENNNNDETPVYPASYDSNNIISVAATDNELNKESNSNYGVDSVDVAAPGPMYIVLCRVIVTGIRQEHQWLLLLFQVLRL